MHAIWIPNHVRQETEAPAVTWEPKLLQLNSILIIHKVPTVVCLPEPKMSQFARENALTARRLSAGFFYQLMIRVPSANI